MESRLCVCAPCERYFVAKTSAAQDTFALKRGKAFYLVFNWLKSKKIKQYPAKQLSIAAETYVFSLHK